MPRWENASNNPNTLDMVAKLFKQGKSDKEIARIMGITPATAQKCRLKRGLRKNLRRN